MLCGIKWWAFTSKSNAYRIIELANLKVTSNYNTKREVLNNGEPKTFTKYGRHNGWHIQVKKETKGYKLEVRGSLHKIHLGNNSGSFTGLQVVKALEEMYTLFDVDPANIIIQNIEVGINLSVWFQVYPYLCTNLLYHKKKVREEGDLKGIGFVFTYDDYLVKIYQKEEQILRFEIRYTSQAKIRSFGIQTAADLHEEITNKLAGSLLLEWGQVITKDSIDFFNDKANRSGLTTKELCKLRKFTSSGYQQDYKKELNDARLAGNMNSYESLRIAANRLSRYCVDFIKKRGDQTHTNVERLIGDGIDLFRGTWRENVTVSPYDKAEENVTYSDIVSTKEKNRLFKVNEERIVITQGRKRKYQKKVKEVSGKS